MNTCYPARIVSFDPVTQTAVVKLMIERYFSNLDEEYVVLPTQELVDVPCHFPRGGGYSITMPIVAGDDCLVLFAQRGIDHWLYEGIEETGGLLERPSPQHKRRNSISDALALIGFGSGIVAEEPLVIKEYNVDAIELRNEDRSQRVSLVVDTGDIEINTSTYDKLNVPVEGEDDAVLQISSSVLLAKDGSVTIDSLVEEDSAVKTRSSLALDSTGIITIDSQVTDTNQTLVINVEKDIIATTGDSVLTLKHDGSVTLVCSTSLEVTTPTSTFNGDMHVTGDIQCDKTVTASTDCIGGGISLVGHIHAAGSYLDSLAAPVTQKSGASE